MSQHHSEAKQATVQRQNLRTGRMRDRKLQLYIIGVVSLSLGFQVSPQVMKQNPDLHTT